MENREKQGAKNGASVNEEKEKAQVSTYAGVNENYLAYVRTFAPPTKHFHNCMRAFMVGGLICCIGQFLRTLFETVFLLTGDELAGATSMALIFLGCLLTGLGVYDRIGKAAGAGSIVPITGFANSVCSPALEFKSEGMITGLAAKMFTVAGPIIVYGVLAGAAVGLIYFLLGLG
ncbi:MAG: stage V sporulation protein AC [Bacillota bacterium]|nr:MAG: stage V sporulation protein AC [Bacillota bacterium]